MMRKFLMSLVLVCAISTGARANFYETNFDTVEVQRELLFLARTCYGEARSESPAGQAAVIWTVINRKNSRSYPGTIEDVVTQPYQYSAWNTRNPNRGKMLSHTLKSKDARFKRCVFISIFVMYGHIEDETGGAMDYHSVAVLPKWASKYRRVLQKGGHIFYLRK